MTELWTGRDRREKILIGIMGALILGFAAWFVMTRDGSTASPAEVLAEAQSDRELFLRAAPRLTAGATATGRADFSRGDLINLARARDIALSRVQPQNDGGLSIWVDGAETTALYGLIQDVLNGYDVQMQNALISAAPGGGVSAQFTVLANSQAN